MKSPSKTKRFVYGTIGGLGIFAGAAGIAAAATRQPSPTTPPAASAESADRNEAPETTYRSSVTLAEQPGAPELSDAEELKQLQGLAKISAADAEAAATAAVPGKASPAELEDEDGNVVFDVHVTAADGTVTEVIVDAGNGKVLHQEKDDDHDGTEKGGETNDSGADAGTEAQNPTTSAAPGN